MARIKGENGFLSGMVGNVSFYKRKDLEGVIVRTKGGPSKNMLKKSPKFANTRKRNVEFGVCSKMGAQIRHKLHKLAKLSDYNASTALNSLASIILKTDVEHELGKRSICLSKNRDLLKGFSFNKVNLLESYFTGLYRCNVNKDAFSAQIDISPITTSVHLNNADSFQYFRWIMNVAVVADFEYSEEKNQYIYNTDYYYPLWTSIVSPWMSLQSNHESESLKIEQVLETPLQENQTVVVGFGIEFGRAINNEAIVAVKVAGAAKIVAVV